MKRNVSSLLLLLLMISGFSISQAQPVRNAVEKGQDRNQIQNDQATIQRDRGEISQFRGNRVGFVKAVDEGNVQLCQGYQIKLINLMQNEVSQGEAKVAQARRELGQSHSEVRSDNREVRRDRAQNRPVAAAGDRQDRRDDIRDVKDDRNDLAEREARVNRQRAILADFKAVVINTGSMQAVRAKLQILDEFEQTMIRDMGENYEELQEDKGELREDRRETREDRNHR